MIHIRKIFFIIIILIFLISCEKHEKIHIDKENRFIQFYDKYKNTLTGFAPFSGYIINIKNNSNKDLNIKSSNFMINNTKDSIFTDIAEFDKLNGNYVFGEEFIVKKNKAMDLLVVFPRVLINLKDANDSFKLTDEWYISLNYIENEILICKKMKLNSFNNKRVIYRVDNKLVNSDSIKKYSKISFLIEREINDID